MLGCSNEALLVVGWSGRWVCRREELPQHVGRHAKKLYCAVLLLPTVDVSPACSTALRLALVYVFCLSASRAFWPSHELILQGTN